MQTSLKFENRSKEQQKPNFGGGYKSCSSGAYKGNHFQNTYRNTSSTFGGGNKGSSSQTKEDSKGEKHIVFVPKEKFENRRKCFKCQSKGHIASECPTKRALTMRQYEEMLKEEELYEFLPQEMHDEEEEEDAFTEDANEDKILGVKRRALHIESTPKAEQRENLFHIRCRIGDHTCKCYCG